MKVTDEIVDRVAKLAKLKFEGKEKEEIKNDLNRVLELCEYLNKIDTNGVEPLVFMTDEINRWREDELKENSISKEQALKNAPEKNSDYFKVPKVIER